MSSVASSCRTTRRLPIWWVACSVSVPGSSGGEYSTADGRWPIRSGGEAFKRISRRKNRHALGGRSEEHTSELQSLMRISYAVFCLKKKRTYKIRKMCEYK